MNRQTPHRTGLLLSVGALLCLAVGPLVVHAQDGEYLDDRETCLACHEDMGEAYARNVHAHLADGQQFGIGRDCEACHGPGATHADSGEPEDIYLPLADGGAASADVCLSCHSRGSTMNWAMGDHAMSDMACQSCHDIHGREAAPSMMREPVNDLCSSCHLEMQAKMHLPSHHPLKEGMMDCVSCHDPHEGGFAGQMAVENERELCLDCHAQHAGPFIFEHSPVEEGCGVCHDPHGAVANNLLHQNEPFLCLQCHQPHFHAGLTGIEGDYSIPGGPSGDDSDYAGLTGTSSHDGFKQAMMTKCSQCHQSVHGTDLPSQSVFGQGRALNR